VDEAGRRTLAGPVAAAILPHALVDGRPVKTMRVPDSPEKFCALKLEEPKLL